MATSKVDVTEGSGKSVATYDVSEDATTKQIQRVSLNDSAGAAVAPLTDTQLRATAVPVSVPTDPFGANADAASASGSISAKLRAIATALGITALDLGSGTGGSRTLRFFQDTAQFIGGTGTSTAATQRVTLATDIALPTLTTLTGGGVAHDGADSGNPHKIGGRAVSAEIAAVANNDRTDSVHTLTGKQIVQPYSNPENFVSGAITTAMTGTTSTSLVAAAGAGLRNYLTTIIVSNAHATVGTDVVIQDGSGGTVLMTIPAAAVYGGAALALPTPLRQPTANTAIFCANVTTGASTKVSVVGYKGV